MEITFIVGVGRGMLLFMGIGCIWFICIGIGGIDDAAGSIVGIALPTISAAAGL